MSPRGIIEILEFYIAMRNANFPTQNGYQCRRHSTVHYIINSLPIVHTSQAGITSPVKMIQNNST